MGVPGLWTDVEALCKTVHIRSFHGKTIGVDAANWMHKAGVDCAMDLANGSSDSLVRNIVKRAAKLVKAGWTLVFVFDGLDPPMKAAENKDRLVTRMRTRELGVNLTLACASLPQNSNERRSAERVAKDILEKDPVVGEYAALTSAGLRAAGFQTRVAPMEAEAQLAYMCRTGRIFAVLSEDTDTVMYYAPRVIRRVDGLQCQFYDRNGDWGQCGPISKLQAPELFVAYCVLSGCDYLEWAVGVKKGAELAQWLAAVAQSGNAEDATVEVLLERAIREKSLTLPPVRHDATVRMVFKAAFAILHHLVFDDSAPNEVTVRSVFPIPAQRLERHAALLTEACGCAAAIAAQGQAQCHSMRDMYYSGASILAFPPPHPEPFLVEFGDGKTMRVPASCTTSTPPQYIPLLRRSFELLHFDAPQKAPDMNIAGLSWWCNLCKFGQGSRDKHLQLHCDSKMHVGRVHLDHIRRCQQSGSVEGQADVSASARCIVLVD